MALKQFCLLACRDERSSEQKALMDSWLRGPSPDGWCQSCQDQAGLPTELGATVTVVTTSHQQPTAMPPVPSNQTPTQHFVFVKIYLLASSFKPLN